MIADRISGLRNAFHMSQADLAKKLNVTRNGVNSWEQGLSLPSLASLVKIANYFNVSTDYLLEINDETNIATGGLSAEDIALIVTLINKIKSAPAREKSEYA